MRKIAVLTSGGDAPGMNAAIRAIVRTSLNKNMSIIGFKNGYEGIIDNDYIAFDKRLVGNIIPVSYTHLRYHETSLHLV